MVVLMVKSQLLMLAPVLQVLVPQVVLGTVVKAPRLWEKMTSSTRPSSVTSFGPAELDVPRKWLPSLLLALLPLPAVVVEPERTTVMKNVGQPHVVTRDPRPSEMESAYPSRIG